MIIQQIVDPSKIESELLRIWEGLVKENKMRASLFNLVVYNRASPRTDYVRSIVQKVIEKFPCRVLFISHDPDASVSYLKTAVSVAAPKGSASAIACDHIDIGVAGTDVERVPYLILPHIIPDLPVYLLWTEDPCTPNPLFKPLCDRAHRLIFDSECADSLLPFAQKLLALKKETNLELADLNWARTEGWRDLVTSIFDSPQRINQLQDLASVQLTYNARETEFFCHLKVQSIYLLAWLSNRLGWKLKKSSRELKFQFEADGKKLDAAIQSALWPKLGSGTVISVECKTSDETLYQFMRLPDRYHYVGIQISTPEKCELPYEYVLGQTATGQSLVQEITRKGTSRHYLGMLEELTTLDRDNLC